MTVHENQWKLKLFLLWHYFYFRYQQYIADNIKKIIILHSPNIVISTILSLVKPKNHVFMAEIRKYTPVSEYSILWYIVVYIGIFVGIMSKTKIGFIMSICISAILFLQYTARLSSQTYRSISLKNGRSEIIYICDRFNLYLNWYLESDYNGFNTDHIYNVFKSQFITIIFKRNLLIIDVLNNRYKNIMDRIWTDIAFCEFSFNDIS